MIAIIKTIMLLNRRRLKEYCLKMITEIKIIRSLLFKVIKLIKIVESTVIQIIMEFSKSHHLRVRSMLMIESNKTIKIQSNSKSTEMLKKMNNLGLH